jgi:hypothetical protein
LRWLSQFEYIINISHVGIRTKIKEDYEYIYVLKNMKIRGSVWRSLDWKTKLGTCIEHEPKEPHYIFRDELGI